MNKWIAMGRVCADINEAEDVHYTSGENATCITKFRVAIDRRPNKNNPDAPTADFFTITAWGKLGEFAKNYLHKGTKIVFEAHLQNNNYTDANGKKVYRDQYVADSIEFAESKKAQEANNASTTQDTSFLNVNEDELNAALPFA